MPKNTHVRLDSQFASFVSLQIARGRYGSPSEVVEAGLRLLEEHERHNATIAAALAEGEASGPSVPFDFDGFIAAKLSDRDG
jgi:antitoxin ParD1/3/4